LTTTFRKTLPQKPAPKLARKTTHKSRRRNEGALFAHYIRILPKPPFFPARRGGGKRLAPEERKLAAKDAGNGEASSACAEGALFSESAYPR
jgi:hypothetical protein